MLLLTVLVASALLWPAPAHADNVTETDACGLSLDGPWSQLLEDWATTPLQSNRQGRILAIPQNKNYYITDRIDLVPPPLGPPHGHHGPPYSSGGNYGPPAYAASGSQGPPAYTASGNHGPPPYSASGNHGPPAYTPSGSHGPPPYSASGSHGPPSYTASGEHGSTHMTSQVLGSPSSVPTGTPPGPQPYSEWQGPPPPSGNGNGKIVNRPPKPYKDQFKPSYEYPQGPNQPPSHAPPKPTPAVDRVDEQPPRRQVSETDLYLLSAIEKLVYRVDLMEKRLRKMEESMHQIVVGQGPKEEPCVSNFTRVRGVCYHFSNEAADWKTASITCRKMKSHLLEIDTEQERKVMFSALLADKRNRGVNWWTGGLNPGLLWIWSYSASPIVRNSTTASPADAPAVAIGGDGRCLALLHDAPAASYVYRGEDCALRHRFVCEKEEDKTKLSNEIERVSRKLHLTTEKLQEIAQGTRGRRRAKIAWDEQASD